MNTAFEQINSLTAAAPDLALLRKAKQSFNDRMLDIEVFHTQTDYLPSLYDKFNRLNTTLNQVNIKLRDGSQRLQYDLDSRAKILQGYLAELTESVDDDERLEILGDIAKELNVNQRNVRTEVGIMASSLLSISELFDRTSTLRNLVGFNTEMERLPAEIEQIEASRAKIEAERATLTQAINAIESKGFGDIAKDALLTGEKVAALGPTPPEAAVIALAMDLLKQSLEKLDVSLNFLGLIRLRDDMRQRINEISATVRAKQQELNLVGRRIKMIEAVHAFDDHAQEYKIEFSNVVSTLRAYETSLTLMSNVDMASVEEFITASAGLVNYLRQIR